MSPRKPHKPDTDRIIALCYVRKSFTRNETDVLSPERQRANIQAMCDRHGWIPEWYEDVDGHKSGRTEKNRPGWLALKRRLSDPHVVAVVANDLARLHRRAWHVGRTMEDLDEFGIRLVFAAPGRDIDTSTPQGRLLIQFMAMQDEAYADDVSARQRDSIAHRKAQGKSIGMPPFGARRSAQGYLEPTPDGVWLRPDGVYVPGAADDPPEDGGHWFGYYDGLLRLFALYSENRIGLNRLAYQLTEEGWRFRDRKGRPRPFTRDDVRRIIANWREYAGLPAAGVAKTRNAGKLPPPDETLYDTGRAVVPLDLLRAVAEVQHGRSVTLRPYGVRRTARIYPLNGLIYCAHCEEQARRQGNPGLRSRLGGATQNGHSWYRHVEGRRCGCQRRSVRVADFEADFVRLLALLTLTPEAVEQLEAVGRSALPGATREDDEAFERERAHNLARLKRKADANRYLFAEGEITREEFERQRDQVVRETAWWQNRTTDSSRISLELRQCVAALNQVAGMFTNAPAASKQSLARSLFDHLVYDLDTGQIVDFRLHAWADRYMILRASLNDARSTTSVSPMPHSGLQGTGLTLLDQLRTSAAHYLRDLYAAVRRVAPPAERNADIRARAAAGEPLSALASAYGISPQRVSQIVRRRNH